MPDAMPLIFVGVVGLMIVLAIVGWYQARKRREALARWAARHGLTFTREKRRGLDDAFPEFDCLRKGSNRYAHNIIEGAWEGRDLLAFDYHYETHSTDSKGRRSTHHHHFSAVLLRARVPLKPLVIRNENLFDKVAGFFGFEDIDFESAEFSRQFAVKAPDRKWAYDVLHGRTIQFLLDQPRFSLEFDRSHVLAWRSRRLKPEQIEQAAGVIDGVLDRLPEYVRQQQMQGT